MVIQFTGENVPRRSEDKRPLETPASFAKTDSADVVAAAKAPEAVSVGSTLNGTLIEDLIAAASPASGLTFPLQVSDFFPCWYEKRFPN